MNGFIALFIELLIIVGSIFAMILFAKGHLATPLLGLFGVLLSVIFPIGFRKLEPNEAMVMVFFGKYKGTFTKTGFHWVNPFMTSKKVSLRARNLNPDNIKVNDKTGNPIMIGQILVWKLKDTYKAMFEIDSQTLAGTPGTNQASVSSRMHAFESFIKVQSDAALREVAGMYAYDENEATDNELTLRSGGKEINDVLLSKLNERLEMSGLEVIEARINYLAYASEIAAVMLRRQQAADIVSVDLLDELPPIAMRTNGSETGKNLKGHFKLKSGEKCLVFVMKEPPYIELRTPDALYFLNDNGKEKTEALYRQLKQLKP